MAVQARLIFRLGLAIAALAMPGCAAVGDAEPRAGMAEACADEAGLRFICGTGAVEELVELAGGEWLLGGRLNVGGPLGFVAIGRAAGSAQAVEVQLAGAADGNCPAPPDPARWSFDGLALSGDLLFAANHGGREAIEIFAVEQRGDGAPALRWTGCLPMPAGTLGNALAPDGAGGLYVTSFHDPADPQAWAKMARGEATGSLWYWPGAGGFVQVKIGPLSGANGIAISPQGTIYVSAWARSEVVAFDPASGTRRVIALPFLPDNLHWDADGALLVGGQRARVADIAACGAQCPQAWIAARIDPASGTVAQLAAGPGTHAVNYATGVQRIGGELWITLRGDNRIARD